MLASLAVLLLLSHVVILAVLLIGGVICECRAQLQTLRATVVRLVRK